MKKIMRNIAAGCISLLLFVLAGCALATPTVVPPLTNQLGYHVPNYRGITTVGIVKGTLRVEQEKLKVFDNMAHLTLQATEDVKNGIIDIVAMLGLGGTAALPLALKHVPKATKQELETLQQKEK